MERVEELLRSYNATAPILHAAHKMDRVVAWPEGQEGSDESELEFLSAAADVLASSIDGWEDIRARRPWATAAAAVLDIARRGEYTPPQRRRLLALAEDLLDAWQLRLRAIAAPRILEGVLARHLGGP